MPQDTTLHETCQNLEAGLFNLGKAARDLNDWCLDALAAAQEAAAAAAAAEAQARNELARAVDGQAAAAAEAAILLAQGALGEALAVIADCEAALEVIGEVIARLNHAIGCVRQVRPAFEATYESALALVRSWAGDHQRHQLTYDGDFLTGADLNEVCEGVWVGA
jgi:hypothetical protein